jgi:hypothetical protein
MTGHWHMMTVDEVISAMQSDAGRGLSEKEAGERLARFGPNELGGKIPFLLRGWRRAGLRACCIY